MEYRLNEIEQGLVKTMADRRSQNNRLHGVKPQTRGPQSDYDSDFEGAAGEVAFCALKNVYPALDIAVRSSASGTDDNDCIVQGYNIDVKTSGYAQARLLAVATKKATADYFALMVGTFPVYTFRGYMAVGELLQPGRLISLGHGKVYAAEQSELRMELPDEAMYLFGERVAIKMDSGIAEPEAIRQAWFELRETK